MVKGVRAHFARTGVGDKVDGRGFLSRLHICDGRGANGGDGGADEEEEDATHSGHCISTWGGGWYISKRWGKKLEKWPCFWYC